MIFGGQTVEPSDSKVVRIYIDGENRIIPTRASTVREMLDRADIYLGDQDLVEPSLDSPISSQEFNVNVYRARPVTVVDENGKRVIAKTAETSPATMAKRAGFDLYPEDIVAVVEPDKSLDQGVLGTQVTINRAVPVKMNLYGTTYDIRTHATTVEDLAKERNISFDDKSVLPAPKTALKPNDVVFITQPGKQIISSEEAIQNKEETIFDTGMAVGQTEVRTEGSVGRKAIVYELTADGRKVALNEVIISQPVTRVVVKGKKVTTPIYVGDKSAVMSAAGIAPEDHFYANSIITKESGWNATARNKSSGAYGLCQALPGTKMASAGGDWETNPVTQLKWCNSYANARHKGWQGAYNFWQVNRWW